MKKLLFVLFLACGLASPAWAAVDINTASQSELEAVKGLGPAKARAIIEYREKHGPYRSIDDLTKVKGLGKASVAKLKHELAMGEVKPAEKPKK
ncbi:competence protein ComEA [Sulfuritortus calidifontis]|uniref:Competence protein ComEA n=1 Tax=Sulfuritortus calidifontis TaxID=1914471 RepID=A0A4R3K0I8_9PROT|nr:ComEA family DNA-binding protein [Sulfuritortus calidifontis]TCS73468.1 competence protein ComEA [Sulfuritortus calidifontis]